MKMLFVLELTYFADKTDETSFSDLIYRLNISLESEALDMFALGGDVMYSSTVMLLMYGECGFSLLFSPCVVSLDNTWTVN